MINQTRQPRLLIVALIGAIVSLLAYQSFGGNTRTIVIDPAVVGTVNLEKVYGSIPQKALAEQSLQGFGQSLDETINGFLDEIEVLEADLEGLSPNSQRYEEMTAELMRKTLEYEGFVQFANNRLELEKAEALRDIYLELRSAIARLSQRNGYDLVIVDDTVGDLTPSTEQEMQRQISARRVLYGARTIDITDLVIAEMNTQR